jgi:hypothetical protein
MFKNSRYFRANAAYTASMHVRFVLVGLLVCSLCAAAGVARAESTVESDRTAESSAAKLTLSLDDAPLLQILYLLGNTGPAHFRFGALPDAVVSVSWKDEDPLLSLDELVRRAGLRLQHTGSNYFVLPLEGKNNEPVPAGAWTQWTKAMSPPRAALSGPDESMKVKLSGTLAEPDKAKQDKPATTVQDVAWQLLQTTISEDRSPAVTVQSQQPAAGITPEATWLRCQMPLSVVPHGVRLLLESATPCDFFINGAPLTRNWSGLRAFDVEPLLRRGPNFLAVRWPRQLHAPRETPVLRYEWNFDGGAPGAGLPGEIARDHE